ncbi:MAG: methyltransferase regulatory domain-containing protein [Geminicoccaceae bacterium]
MTDSYRVTVPYSWDYQPELNPLRAHLVLLRAGFRPPAAGTACELGYGQGASLVLHAAASPVAWYGTDFNPAHAVAARRLATASGAQASIGDEPFASFCARGDLPDFDFIGLHGVWSWIADTERETILRFVHARLRPGGVLYLGYNALPGWADFVPLRQLLVEHAEASGGQGADIVDHVGEAMAFAARLLATGPAMARDNPGLAGMFAALERRSVNALAHELFNRDWQPMFFSAVARRLGPLGLAHAGAADLSDIVDRLDMSATQRRLIEGLADPMLRQLVRDSIFNKRFRRDYWVKDPQLLSAAERDAAIRDERVIATGAATVLPRPLSAALTLQPDGPDAGTVAAVLAGLSARRPRRLGDIEEGLAGRRVAPLALLDAVMFLAAHGLVESAQEAQTAAAMKHRTDRLNRHLLEDESLGEADIALASPVTGGGVALSASERQLLRALHYGQAPARPSAANEQSRPFLDERLPLLRALQVI